MEGADDGRVGQQRGRLLGRRALLDLEDEGAPLVEAERVHAVDDDLAGQRGGEALEQVAVPVPRHRDDDDVARGGGALVVRAGDVAAGRLGQRLAVSLGALGAAAADHDGQPGRGEPARQAAALRSGATEDGDSRGGQGLGQAHAGISFARPHPSPAPRGHRHRVTSPELARFALICP